MASKRLVLLGIFLITFLSHNGGSPAFVDAGSSTVSQQKGKKKKKRKKMKECEKKCCFCFRGKRNKNSIKGLKHGTVWWNKGRVEKNPTQ